MSYSIIGCGDIGRRIAKQLIAGGIESHFISAWVRRSRPAAELLNLNVHDLDLDLLAEMPGLRNCDASQLVYTVAPQKDGIKDERSRALLKAFHSQSILPKKVVLISTTGVYGDHQGNWVNEQTPAQPATDRGKRRLDSEQVWRAWSQSNTVPLIILRVPGIYAYSRLPVERIKKGTPVVRASECGFTNRIHAEDLAGICIASMHSDVTAGVFNVTDGTPGKISEYLQEAAKVLELPELPEIPMDEAQQQLSEGMLSYLGESRKISNQKMLKELEIRLRYPDFREGIKH